MPIRKRVAEVTQPVGGHGPAEPKQLHPETFLELLQESRKRGTLAINISVPIDGADRYGMIAIDMDKLIELTRDEYIRAGTLFADSAKPKPKLKLKR